MHTTYLQFKLQIFIPNNIRKHKSFVGKILHSWLRKYLKKLVKHSFSMLFGKNCALVNELPRDDHMVYDYLTGIVKRMICHRNKNNDVHQKIIMMSIRHLNDHECRLSHHSLLIPLQEDQHNQKQEIIPVNLKWVESSCFFVN